MKNNIEQKHFVEFATLSTETNPNFIDGLIEMFGYMEQLSTDAPKVLNDTVTKYGKWDSEEDTLRLYKNHKTTIDRLARNEHQNLQRLMALDTSSTAIDGNQFVNIAIIERELSLLNARYAGVRLADLYVQYKR